MRKKVELLDEIDKQISTKVTETVQTELDELQELIQSYGTNKAQMDEIKKACDSENSQIKELMQRYGKTAAESKDFKVTYSITHRETLNEDKLLSLFTCIPSFIEYAQKYGIVKTREYIDMDALESFLYKEELDSVTTSALDDCRETKDVPMLRIAKKKKGKN